MSQTLFICGTIWLTAGYICDAVGGPGRGRMALAIAIITYLVAWFI